MENDNIYKDLQDITKKQLPVRIQPNADGSIQSIQYDTEWKEGGTKPKTNKKGQITGYKEDYKTVSLTKSDIKKVDEYIAKVLNK